MLVAHTYSCIRQNCQEMGSNQEILLGIIAQATEAFKDLGEE